MSKGETAMTWVSRNETVVLERESNFNEEDPPEHLPF